MAEEAVEAVEKAVGWLDKIKGVVNSSWLKGAASVAAAATVLTAARDVGIRLHKRIKNLPPGPIGIPLFGSGYQILNDWRGFLSSLLEYGPVAWVQLGRVQVLFLNDPEVARKVMKHLTRRPPIFPADVCKVDLAATNEPWWHNARQLLQRAIVEQLNSSALDDVMRNGFKHVVAPALMEAYEKKQKWVPTELARKWTFGSLVHAATGVSPDFDDPQTLDMVDAAQDFVKAWIEVAFVRRWLPVAPGFEGYYRIRRGYVRMEGHVARIMNDHRERKEAKKAKELKKEAGQEEEDEEEEEEEAGDEVWWLDTCERILEEDGVSKPDRHQLVTSTICAAFQAGISTTSEIIDNACMYLARNPELQQEMYEKELKPLGEKGMTVKKLNQLHLLRAVVNESLRLNGTMTPEHLLTKEMTLDIGEGKTCTVPKDTCVMINVFGAHVHDKMGFGKNVAEFDVNHFLNEKGEFQRPPGGLFSFGYGRRDCAGKNLARNQLLLMVAWLVLKFDIQGPEGKPDFHHSQQVILEKLFPVKLRAVPRD